MTDEALLSYLDIPFKFWACPRCPSSMIKWEKEVATCQTCGKRSTDSIRK